MLKRAQLWLLLLLLPVLAAGSPEGAYSLFYCAQMGTLQSSCCCAARQHDQPCDQVERGSCCDERRIELPGTEQNTSAQVLVLQAPVAVSRIRLQDLFAPKHAQISFVVREAPRAIGPPLILRTQKLLI